MNRSFTGFHPMEVFGGYKPQKTETTTAACGQKVEVNLLDLHIEGCSKCASKIPKISSLGPNRD